MGDQGTQNNGGEVSGAESTDLVTGSTHQIVDAEVAVDVDAQLVQRAQHGDQRAFEMLVVKYQRRIERLIGRMVRDVDLVEDITQETFIRAYRALPN